MLKKIKASALSLGLLLYMCNVQHAHNHDIFPVGDEFGSALSLQFSAGNMPLDIASKPSPSIAPKPRRRIQVKKVRDTLARNNDSVRAGGKSKTTAQGKDAYSSGTRLTGQSSKAGKKKPAGAKRGVVDSARMQKRLNAMLQLYEKRMGTKLFIKSFGRTPAQQAKAMHNNLRRYGVAYVSKVYKQKAAVREIIWAYKANRKRPRKAVMEMERVIRAQVRRGVYISNHLLGAAVDIRSRGRRGARLKVLRAVARLIGGRVLVEQSHFHVDLV